ncbi:hypothetical protein [Streptomyces sp. AS02]|uniref:hypothetical protein n=1 Tax=Streptomyces sp. AS02 TaxID=2938946 RepID=UPI0020201016|nr:hypothetical protein [Streptomyces sp. AS02]MCL8015887.1 hypothetical protein [Streptomyces sp. AS02]
MTATVGVLLPLRIETRFDGARLRLRVIPDEPWLDRHDPLPRAGELDLLERYLAVAGDRPGTPDGRQAWRTFAGQVGGGRAVWLLESFRDGRPNELRDTARLPEIPFFPPHLHVWLVRAGTPPELALTLDVRAERIRADLPDPRDPGNRRWWESWDEAVEAGVAGEIDLTDFPGEIETLFVTGLGERDQEPARLFAAHAAAGRLGLLSPGDPTNTVDAAAAAHLGDDPDRWLDALSAPATPSSRAVNAALTGSADAFRVLLDDDPEHIAHAEHLVAGLWPALWGFAQTSVWRLPNAEDAAAWAARNLCPEGPWPPLRIGDQPYGLLPVTSLAEWRPAPGDPGVEAGMIGALRVLRARWAQAARERGTVLGAETNGLLDRLAQVPTSTGYRHRDSRPLQLWFMAMLFLGYFEDWIDVRDGWGDQAALAQEIGLDPRRRYASVGGSTALPLPLVSPASLTAGDTAGAMLRRLLQAAATNPALLADPRRLATEVLKAPDDSLLLRLAIRSLQVAVGDIGHAKTGDWSAWLDALLRPDTELTPLERWIGVVTPADLTAGSARVMAGLNKVARLADADAARLDRLLRATVDSSTFRIDPWVTGPALRRLRALGAAGAQWRLGAYGWVDTPRTGEPGPTGGGLLHAPSQPQATTAMILRDRARHDPEPDRWHMDLASGTVRTADRLGAAVRSGLHLSEVLGLEVERIVGDPGTVLRLRRDYPIRVEHAGRRVCDGRAVLAADPSALGLPGQARAGLARLRAGLDAYGDLLVAQAVFDVVEGRAESAGATMDAAAGLARPPDLSVLRTRRPGRTVATSCLLVLPAPEEVVLPADAVARSEVPPATVAEPAFAAFLAAQLGAAGDWHWRTGAGTTVTLADLRMQPVDTLALAVDDLERLVASAGGGEVVERPGSARQQQAVRLAALIGRTPPPESPAGLIERRYRDVREIAQAILSRLRSVSADDRTAALIAARRWGVVPEEGVPDPAARAADLLAKRVAAAPADAAGLSRADLIGALVDLVTPTGRLAVLGRIGGAGLLDGLAVAPDLDDQWLTVVAAVRDPLARLEAHQLAASTPAGAAGAFVAWSNRPDDPWQRNGTGPALVAAYAPAGLHLDGMATGADVAASLLDRFEETIPAAEGATSAVFGFHAPTARPPQAILLAVPPDPDRPLGPADLVTIVAETRELAHARMARPADLVAAQAILPAALLPAEGRLAVRLDPEPT